MEEEIVSLALTMADSPNMSQQQMDYNRGAIWAARQLLDLPQRLMLRMENDLYIEDANSRESRLHENGEYDG
jgi:hypothetical protein